MKHAVLEKVCVWHSHAATSWTSYKNREKCYGVSVTSYCCRVLDCGTTIGWATHAHYKVKLTFPYLWYDTDRCLLVFMYYVPHYGNDDECWNDCQWYNAEGGGTIGRPPFQAGLQWSNKCGDEHCESFHYMNRSNRIKLPSKVMPLSCLKLKSQDSTF
jgi:hypothetical protein